MGYPIKKYWSVIGPVLVKATNEGFANGEMGETFRTGLIKLIPKKGDATKIGDWIVDTNIVIVLWV